jgi:hypothetical protein
LDGLGVAAQTGVRDGLGVAAQTGVRDMVRGNAQIWEQKDESLIDRAWRSIKDALSFGGNRDADLVGA